MGIVKANTITPLQAIRKYCLQCSCGDKKEVDECTISGCPLYIYRMGENTNNSETSTVITVGDMIDAPKVVQKANNVETAKVPDEIIEPISKVDTGTGTICGEEPSHSITPELVPCVKGTGVICGESPVIAEAVTVIKPTKENIVMASEEAEKHSLVEQKTEDKHVKEKKKKVKKEPVKAVVEEVKKEEVKNSLDELDIDDLFD